MLSPSVFVEPGAEVTDSVLLDDVVVGAGARVHRAILDKNVVVPPGVEIGVDHEADTARGLTVRDGLTVLGKGEVVPASDPRVHVSLGTQGKVREPRVVSLGS